MLIKRIKTPLCLLILVVFSLYSSAQYNLDIEGDVIIRDASPSLSFYNNDSIRKARLFATSGNFNLDVTEGSFSFTTSTSTSSATRMVLTNSGNVGIGAFPYERLEVGGNGRAFFGDGNGLIRKGLLIDGIQGESATRIESYDYGTNTGLDLIINSVGEGHVGIDINEPSHILHINGTGRALQSTWATSSDRRVKKNIRTVQNGIDKILKLNPVIFDWIDSYKESNPDLKDNRYGFIAQEAAEVIPQMVTEVEETFGDRTIEDFNVLNTDALLPLIVKALQEQQEIIKTLNAKLDIQNTILQSQKFEIDTQNGQLEDQNSVIIDIASRLALFENGGQ